MRSWQIIEPKKLELVTREGVKPKSKEVRVKVTYASLSASDMLLYSGDFRGAAYPVTMGRHAVGVVVETGDEVRFVDRGDRVAIDPYVACGECPRCVEDEDSCLNLTVSGVSCEGLMSDIVTVSGDNIKKLPEQVSDVDALFVEQIAIATKALDKLDLNKGDHVVIMGASVIGLICAQAAIYYQLVPIMVDSRSDRLSMASKLGAYYTVNSGEVDTYKKVRTITGGRMADAMVYCTATAQKLPNALECLAKNGKAVLTGFCGVAPDLKGDLTVAYDRQIDIYSVSNGSKNFSGAINMLANKSVAVSSFVSKEAEFEEVGAVVEEIAQNPDRYIKVVVKHK